MSAFVYELFFGRLILTGLVLTWQPLTDRFIKIMSTTEVKFYFRNLECIKFNLILNPMPMTGLPWNLMGNILGLTVWLNSNVVYWSRGSRLDCRLTRGFFSGRKFLFFLFGSTVLWEFSPLLWTSSTRLCHSSFFSDQIFYISSSQLAHNPTNDSWVYF